MSFDVGDVWQNHKLLQGLCDGLENIPFGRNGIVWIPTSPDELFANVLNQGQVVRIQRGASWGHSAECREVQKEPEEREHAISLHAVRAREHAVSWAHACCQSSSVGHTDAPPISAAVDHDGSVADAYAGLACGKSVLDSVDIGVVLDVLKKCAFPFG